MSTLDPSNICAKIAYLLAREDSCTGQRARSEKAYCCCTNYVNILLYPALQCVCYMYPSLGSAYGASPRHQDLPLHSLYEHLLYYVN
jgi:hypothetical protein